MNPTQIDRTTLDIYINLGDVETLADLYQVSVDNRSYINKSANLQLLTIAAQLPQIHYSSFIELLKAFDRRHLGYRCHFSRKLEDCIIEMIRKNVNIEIIYNYLRQLIIETPIEKLRGILLDITSNVKANNYELMTELQLYDTINNINMITYIASEYGRVEHPMKIKPNRLIVDILKKYRVAYVNALLVNLIYDISSKYFDELVEYIGDDIFLQFVANIFSGKIIFEINFEEIAEKYNIRDLYLELREVVDAFNYGRYQLDKYFSKYINVGE